MKLGMRRRLLALYPRDWRARYGDEFAALLAQLPLTEEGFSPPQAAGFQPRR